MLYTKETSRHLSDEPNRLGHYFLGACKGRKYYIPLIFSDLHCLELSREVGAPLACAREIMSQPII
jgi:hypothetical protein